MGAALVVRDGIEAAELRRLARREVVSVNVVEIRCG